MHIYEVLRRPVVTEKNTDLMAQDKYVFEERGEIEVKGKGLIKTYLLKGKKQLY